jgi:hypothetical protein
MSEQYVFSVTGFKDDVRIEQKPNESKYLINSNVGDEVDVLITDVNHGTYFIKVVFCYVKIWHMRT